MNEYIIRKEKHVNSVYTLVFQRKYEDSNVIYEDVVAFFSREQLEHLNTIIDEALKDE